VKIIFFENYLMKALINGQFYEIAMIGTYKHRIWLDSGSQGCLLEISGCWGKV